MDRSNPRPLAALAVASPEGGQRGSIGTPPNDDTLYALESPALDPLFVLVAALPLTALIHLVVTLAASTRAWAPRGLAPKRT